MKTRILQIGEPNKNGRIYTTEAADTITSKGEILGGVGVEDHDFATYSHLVKNLRVEDGWVVGDVMVLDNPRGNALRKMLDAGARLDFRASGWGDVAEDGTVSNYTVRSIDAVFDGA